MVSLAPVVTGYGSRKNSRRVESLGMRYWVATGKKIRRNPGFAYCRGGIDFTVSHAPQRAGGALPPRLPNASNNPGQIGPGSAEEAGVAAGLAGPLLPGVRQARV